ncbi:MAG: phosphate ABC transporter substrate-binding protein [Ignavibacteria bacterium]|nr:phosphate ABC transporter substrate-binding protein [Ignavibacteria bacterium]
MKLLTVVFLFFLLLTNCSIKPVEVAKIVIMGSDSMLELTENLAESYMKKNPGISIYAYGGGTSKGVDALIKGKTDICTASRNLKPEEAKALAEYYGTVGLFFLVAKDALSIYLNSKNTIKDLSLQELKELFTCKIKNWNQVGGKNAPVVLVIRNPNSGTHYFFKENILGGGEYCQDVIVESTTKNVIEYIESNENAVGYGAMGFKGNTFSPKIDGIEPSEKNAQNDTYPLTRYLHFFTSSAPKGAVKDFIDWVLSPEGQAIIKKSGYISLWEIPF